jgi:O-antigen/teichoic acid export membrane protein
MLKRTSILQHIVNHMGVAIASKFVPLASIFIYSRFMTVPDYGVINLFMSYIWIFAIVMSLNLHTGIGRYIYSVDAEFGSFLGTSLLALGAIYLAAVIVVLFYLDHFSLLLGLPRQLVFLMLFVVGGQIAESLFTQVTIFHQHSSLLLKVVSIKAAATFLLSIGLLFILDREKYLAIVYADAISSFSIFVYVLGRLRATVRWTFKVNHFRYLLNYSLPLIPYMLSLTLLSQFDRVLIDRYFGKESTGLYSLAYNFGMLLLMVVTAVLNTFSPAFFAALNKKDYARVIKNSKNVFALAVVVTTILVLFGQDLAALFAPAKYASGFDLIPTVAIGGLCFVVFQIWVRVIAYVNRTMLISTIAIVATAINLTLNYWLLPIFGYKIAALTTVVAYLVMSLGCVAMLNYVVRLFRVNVLPEMIYVTAMVALTLFFQSFELQILLATTIKLTVLVFMIWHLKDQLLELIQLKKVALPA